LGAAVFFFERRLRAFAIFSSLDSRATADGRRASAIGAGLERNIGLRRVGCDNGGRR
jgi:hypothetical protein